MCISEAEILELIKQYFPDFKFEHKKECIKLIKMHKNELFKR